DENTSRSLLSHRLGEYEVLSLKPGRYSVTVEQKSFDAPTKSDIVLEPRRRLALAPKQEHQFNKENDHDQHLQNEGPALVKLIHHELVQLAGSMQFAVDQPAVVLHAHFGGGQAIQACRKHIAQELDRGIHPFRELANIQTNRV